MTENVFFVKSEPEFKPGYPLEQGQEEELKFPIEEGGIVNHNTSYDQKPDVSEIVSFCLVCNEEYLSNGNEECVCKSCLETYFTRKRYNCEICGAGYSTVAALKTHWSLHKGTLLNYEEEDRRSMGVPTTKSSTDHRRNIHMSDPTCLVVDNKRHQSQACNLPERLPTNPAANMFRCNDCGKTFRQQRRDWTSQTSHNCKADSTVRKLSYPCDGCGISFFRWLNRKRHQLSGLCNNNRKASKRVQGRFSETCDTSSSIQMSRSTAPAEKRENVVAVKQIQCDNCGTQFRCLRNYRRHKLRNVCLKGHKSNRLEGNMNVRNNSFSSTSTQNNEPLPTTALLTDNTSIARSVAFKSFKPAKPFSCKLCSKVYGSESGIRTHMWTHFPMFCKYCGEKFTRKVILIYHELWHETGQKRFTCSLCSARFIRPDNFHEHVKTHQGKPFDCEQCGSIFQSKRALVAHGIAAHQVGWPRTCKVCQEDLWTSREVEQHRKRHRHPESIPCSFCGKRYLNKSSLLRHENRHRDPIEFLCSFCGKILHHQLVLEIHEKSHEKKKPHECNICGKVFADKYGFDRHFRQFHNPKYSWKCECCCKKFQGLEELEAHKAASTVCRSGTPFVCGNCGKQFRSPSLLKRHEGLHLPASEKPHKCQRCDYSSEQFTHFKLHSRIHTRDEAFKCLVPECGASFSSDVFLIRHLRGSHPKGDVVLDQLRTLMKEKSLIKQERAKENRKKYKQSGPRQPLHVCKICGKTFQSKYYLQDHERMHSGAYICKTCGKQIGSSLALKNHERVHTGVRPFVCTICDMKFKHRNTLRRHEERSHRGGKRSFQCQHCKKSYFLKNDLDNHMGLHRGGKCRTCGRQIISLERLKIHEATAHRVIVKIHCGTCQKAFFRVCDLNKHKKTHAKKMRKVKSSDG